MVPIQSKSYKIIKQIKRTRNPREKKMQSFFHVQKQNSDFILRQFYQKEINNSPQYSYSKHLFQKTQSNEQFPCSIARYVERKQKQNSDTYVVEIIKGKNLLQKAEEGLTESAIFSVFCQMLQAVQWLQKMQIPIKQLSLQDIIYGDNHKIKIVSFDCQCLIYLSPKEQNLQANSNNFDVWNLGILLCLMLFDGKLPFSNLISIEQTLCLPNHTIKQMINDLQSNFEQSQCRRKLKFYSLFWSRILAGIFCRKGERMDLEDIKKEIQNFQKVNQPMDRNQQNKKKFIAYHKYKKDKFGWFINIMKVEKPFLKAFLNKFSYKNKVFFKFYYFLLHTKFLFRKYASQKNSLDFFLKNSYQFKVTAQSFRLCDYKNFLSQVNEDKEDSTFKNIKSSILSTKSKLQTNCEETFKKQLRKNFKLFCEAEEYLTVFEEKFGTFPKEQQAKYEMFEDTFLYNFKQQPQAIEELLHELLKKIQIPERRLREDFSLEEVQFYYKIIFTFMVQRILNDQQYENLLVKIEQREIIEGEVFLTKKQKQLEEIFKTKNKEMIIVKVQEVEKWANLKQ